MLRNQEENPNGSLASIVVSPGVSFDTPVCHQPQICTVNPDVIIWPSDQRTYFTELSPSPTLILPSLGRSIIIGPVSSVIVLGGSNQIHTLSMSLFSIMIRQYYAGERNTIRSVSTYLWPSVWRWLVLRLGHVRWPLPWRKVVPYSPASLS